MAPLLLSIAILSCAPHSNNQRQDTPQDHFFDCNPSFISIQSEGKINETIKTEIPSYLGLVNYTYSQKNIECKQSDDSYVDNRITISRIDRTSFTLECLTENLDPEVIQLVFFPSDDAPFAQGIVEIRICVDY